jgi:hypothetical protein
MSPDRKLIHTHIKSYVKTHYFAIFKTIVLLLILSALIQFIFDNIIMALNISALNFLSTVCSQYLSTLVIGVFTLTLVHALRHHQNMSIQKVIEMSKQYKSIIIPLSLEMTVILSLASGFGSLIHPLAYVALLVFVSLAMAFTFPLILDNPTYKAHQLIEASFIMTRTHRVDMMFLQMKPVLIAMIPLIMTLFLNPNLMYANSLNAAIGQVVYWIAYTLFGVLLVFFMGQIFSVFGFVYVYLTADALHPLE